MALAMIRKCGRGQMKSPPLACRDRTADRRHRPRNWGRVMIWMGGLVLGAVTGAAQALGRGGRKLDALQYGAAYAIAFGLIGLAISVVLDRMG